MKLEPLIADARRTLARAQVAMVAAADATAEADDRMGVGPSDEVSRKFEALLASSNAAVAAHDAAARAFGALEKVGINVELIVDIQLALTAAADAAEGCAKAARLIADSIGPASLAPREAAPTSGRGQ